LYINNDALAKSYQPITADQKEGYIQLSGHQKNICNQWVSAIRTRLLEWASWSSCSSFT
jgi:hypothetical protein